MFARRLNKNPKSYKNCISINEYCKYDFSIRSLCCKLIRLNDIGEIVQKSSVNVWYGNVHAMDQCTDGPIFDPLNCLKKMFSRAEFRGYVDVGGKWMLVTSECRRLYVGNKFWVFAVEFRYNLYRISDIFWMLMSEANIKR